MNEYKLYREKEIDIMEQRLRDIIEVENDASDPDAPGALDTLSDNRKLLADPLLMRKAAERFHELFWENDEVTQLEHDAADQAMIEVARKAPAVQSGFSIIRNGEAIELTKDEADAFRLKVVREEVDVFISGWLETIGYRLDDEDKAEEARIVKALSKKENRDRMVAAFSSTMLTSLLPVIGDDDMASNMYDEVLDRLFRPVAERIVEESEDE